MKQSGNKWRKSLISVCVMSVVATASWAQSLIWLGTLGGSYSEALGVSADGSVVVGISRDAAGQNRAFRWTLSGGIQDLGTLPGNSGAWAVSADGGVVVGAALTDGNWRAFRWTVAGGMQNLGTLGGNFSEAYSVSANGSAVVGRSRNADGRVLAFRWTAAGGMQNLGTLGGSESAAYGISTDGNVVVGVASTGGNWRAFRWTAGGGMQDLGTLLGFSSSEAHGVSADGSVVVGWARSGEQDRAFRWTAAGGMQDLGTLGGKCLRDMISTCELGQTRGSAPTETPLCRGNPLWLPPARRGAHVENLTHRHLPVCVSREKYAGWNPRSRRCIARLRSV